MVNENKEPILNKLHFYIRFFLWLFLKDLATPILV